MSVLGGSEVISTTSRDTEKLLEHCYGGIVVIVDYSSVS